MNLSDFASIASVVSSLAVLGSLVYLGLQTHQSTKHSRALVQQGRVARVVDLTLRFAEIDWTEGMDACWAGLPGANPSDQRRFTTLMRALFVSMEDSYVQHQQGLLVGPAFDNFDTSVRVNMTIPGYRIAWRALRNLFAPDFRAHMDSIVASREVGPPAGYSDRWKAAEAEEHRATAV